MSFHHNSAVTCFDWEFLQYLNQIFSVAIVVSAPEVLSVIVALSFFRFQQWVKIIHIQFHFAQNQLNDNHDSIDNIKVKHLIFAPRLSNLGNELFYDLVVSS